MTLLCWWDLPAAFVAVERNMGTHLGTANCCAAAEVDHARSVAFDDAGQHRIAARSLPPD